MLKQAALTLFIILTAVSVFSAPGDTLEPYGTNPDDEFTNRSYFDDFNNKYVFEYRGSDSVTYSIYPNRWEVQAGYINIETNINDVICWPVAYGGLRFRYDLAYEYADANDDDEKMLYRQGHYYDPVDYRLDATVEMTNIDFTDGVLTLEYHDTFEGYEHTWKVEYSIKGKTLVFHIYATDGNTDALGNYCGIFFDRSVRTRNPKVYVLPYIVESNVIFDDNYFYAVYLDRGKSSASNIQVMSEGYSADSIYSGSHTVNWINSEEGVVPVDEVCYLTVSSNLLDVYPSFNIPPSSTKRMLDEKIVLDITYSEDWDNKGKNHFLRVRNILSDFYDYGFRDVFVINHTWQNSGYDYGLPKHYPPGEMYGGLENFKKITEFTNSKGWLFTTHEDYTVMNRPGYHAYWDYENSVGSLSKDRNLDPFERMFTFHSISADKMLQFAVPESTELKENCNTTGAFLDLSAGNNPMTVRQFDLDPKNDKSRTFADGVEYTKELFDAMREIHQGPVVGEGGIGWGRYDTFYAGYLDGVDKFIERETDAFIVPEHELKVVRPMQVNHGLGQYDRFFRFETTNFAEYDFDLYRATEMVYGHSGYVQVKYKGSETLNRAYVKFVREYFMMQQLQSRYTPSNVDLVEFLYYDYDDDKWITQDELLLLGKDMEDVLIKLKYSNGLTIWINHSDEEDFIWEPEIYNGLSLPIPVHGFVAFNAFGELFIACSVMLGDERVDYVMSDKYIFAENRIHSTAATDIGYLSTNGMACVQVNDFNHLDLHLLEGTILSETLFGTKLLQTSERCHVNINYRNINEFELKAKFITAVFHMDVTYYHVPGTWLIDNGRLPADISSHITVSEIDGEMEMPADDINLSTTSGRELVIGNVEVGKKYVVRFSD